METDVIGNRRHPLHVQKETFHLNSNQSGHFIMRLLGCFLHRIPLLAGASHEIAVVKPPKLRKAL